MKFIFEHQIIGTKGITELYKPSDLSDAYDYHLDVGLISPFFEAVEMG